MKTYSILAFLTVATMGLSNTSLNYLNYPTQVRTVQTKNSVLVFVLNRCFSH